MRRLTRRQFAKLAGSAAVVTTCVSAETVAAAVRQAATIHLMSGQAQAPAPQAPPEPKLKLTGEQEEAVRRAVERRDRQLTALRSRTLPYDLEPAFIFEVRRRPRKPGKGA